MSTAESKISKNLNLRKDEENAQVMVQQQLVQKGNNVNNRHADMVSYTLSLQSSQEYEKQGNLGYIVYTYSSQICSIVGYLSASYTYSKPWKAKSVNGGSASRLALHDLPSAFLEDRITIYIRIYPIYTILCIGEGTRLKRFQEVVD